LNSFHLYECDAKTFFELDTYFKGTSGFTVENYNKWLFAE